MKPFLKWAGNKYRIISHIKNILPPAKRLIEPFVGSGAVFLNTNYPDYLLADSNRDLILLYQSLQKDGQNFIDFCQTFFKSENNDKAIFYGLRDLFNTTQDQRLKSALFVYLNRYSFNGLCRYNAKGIFNAPFGQYKKPYFPAIELKNFAKKSQQIIFKADDFTNTIKQASLGDVVYCDPPYAPLSKTANFTSYSSNLFGLDKQIALTNLAKELANKNIPVIISNHDTEFTQEIYRDAQTFTFEVQRYISRDGTKRVKVKEVLAVFR